MEKTPIRIKDIFTEVQRTNIIHLYKAYKLKFIKKEFEVKRYDNSKILKNCNCISLTDINNLLKKIELKYNETKNMNLKFSIETVLKMKTEIENYLKQIERYRYENER